MKQTLRNFVFDLQKQGVRPIEILNRANNIGLKTPKGLNPKGATIYNLLSRPTRTPQAVVKPFEAQQFVPKKKLADDFIVVLLPKDRLKDFINL